VLFSSRELTGATVPSTSVQHFSSLSVPPSSSGMMSIVLLNSSVHFVDREIFPPGHSLPDDLPEIGSWSRTLTLHETKERTSAGSTSPVQLVCSLFDLPSVIHLSLWNLATSVLQLLDLGEPSGAEEAHSDLLPLRVFLHGQTHLSIFSPSVFFFSSMFF